MLENKSTAKQITYKHICWAFSILSVEAKKLIHELKSGVRLCDSDITIEYNVVHEHEFDVKLAGDMLIFVMNTNIVTFEECHPVMKDN